MSQDAKKSGHTRRELFLGAGRIAAAAGLVGLGVSLLLRKQSPKPAGKATADSGPVRCINRGRCSQCPASQQCSLPRGRSYREVTGREGNGD